MIAPPALTVKSLVMAVAPVLNATAPPEVRVNVPDMVAVFARVIPSTVILPTVPSPMLTFAAVIKSSSAPVMVIPPAVAPRPMVPPPERMIVKSPDPTFRATEISISAAVIERLELEVSKAATEKFTVPVLFMVTLLKVIVPPEKLKVPVPVNSEVVAKVRVPAEKLRIAPLDTS